VLRLHFPICDGRAVKLLHVVGARPNFPKLAPVYRAAARAGLEQCVIHTGQHYDDALSAALFRDLGMRAPDINLAVGSGTHASQTALIIERIEPHLVGLVPDWLLVYGDVNSTVAAALVASKLGIRIAHVEAGLRSYDRTMPEEINRILTDRLADLLLTPSREADATLRSEGEPDEEICFVGNVMVDSLLSSLPAARATGFREHVAAGDRTVVVTLHRPSNVDDPQRLKGIVMALRQIAERYAVVFPAHPRTQQGIRQAGLQLGNIRMLPPLGYLEMISLVESAYAVITDSGGLQEETTSLGVPCLTLRHNTERPITIREGTNRLVPEPKDLVATFDAIVRPASARQPEGWDGHAGERIISALRRR
jgi:UDP-N-acetylglucosamine 2-epimerase (non-hydrolysing)